MEPVIVLLPGSEEDVGEQTECLVAVTVHHHCSMAFSFFNNLYVSYKLVT